MRQWTPPTRGRPESGGGGAGARGGGEIDERVVSGTEKNWSGGEGSSDRDKGMGGVQEQVSVPSPYLEVKVVEQEFQGGDEAER